MRMTLSLHGLRLCSYVQAVQTSLQMNLPIPGSHHCTHHTRSSKCCSSNLTARIHKGAHSDHNTLLASLAGKHTEWPCKQAADAKMGPHELHVPALQYTDKGCCLSTHAVSCVRGHAASPERSLSTAQVLPAYMPPSAKRLCPTLSVSLTPMRALIHTYLHSRLHETQKLSADERVLQA